VDDASQQPKSQDPNLTTRSFQTMKPFLAFCLLSLITSQATSQSSALSEACLQAYDAFVACTNAGSLTGSGCIQKWEPEIRQNCEVSAPVVPLNAVPGIQFLPLAEDSSQSCDPVATELCKFFPFVAGCDNCGRTGKKL
jgi:hypothetical protein